MVYFDRRIQINHKGGLMSEESQVKKPIWKKWWIWGIAVVVVIALAGCSSDQDKQGIDERLKIYGAYDSAVAAVKANLKAPATAKFGDMGNSEIKRSDTQWKVQGYVDSENSFGANIRSNYVVILEYRSDNDSFDIMDIQIE